MASLFDPIDELFGVNGQDTGKQYAQAGLNAYGGITPPTAQQLQEQLSKQTYAGDYNPAMEQTVTQDPSAYNQIYTDPTAKAAQLQALSQLQGIGQSGGMTAIDQASTNNILNQTNEAARGARGAVMQNAQARGVGGSGLDIVNQQLANQGAAQTANQQGLGVAANAQARALQAIQQSGQLGGQIEGQNYGEASNKAAAQDAINRFNAQNSQAVMGTNVGNTNQAGLRNVNTRQDISNSNTGIANQQAQYNAGANQTAFNDQIAKAGGVAGQNQDLAAGQRNAAQNQNAFNAGLIGTAGKVVAANASNKKQDQEGYV